MLGDRAPWGRLANADGGRCCSPKRHGIGTIPRLTSEPVRSSDRPASDRTPGGGLSPPPPGAPAGTGEGDGRVCCSVGGSDSAGCSAPAGAGCANIVTNGRRNSHRRRRRPDPHRDPRRARGRGFLGPGGRIGRTGARDVHRSLPDLVLLDIRLPGMSGFELVRKIRSDSIAPDRDGERPLRQPRHRRRPRGRRRRLRDQAVRAEGARRAGARPPPAGQRAGPPTATGGGRCRSASATSSSDTTRPWCCAAASRSR